MSMIFCSMGRVIDALVAVPTNPTWDPGGLYQAAGDTPAVTVSDGPWFNDVIPDELVTIGINATDAQALESNAGKQNARTIGGPLVMDEDYIVLCSIRVWNGGVSQKIVRDRALALFSVYQLALRTDPTLAGALAQQATLATVDLAADDPDVSDGSICWLIFTVHVSNQLRSS